MKLSTRSRYGTRLLLDMAQHYNQGPVQLGDIARRQEISVKYLEQIIIPLKKAHFIESVRGPKGGHILARPPAEITVAEIVALLEDGTSLAACTERAEVCGRSNTCPTRLIWKEASQAMFNTLKSITLADLVEKAGPVANKEFKNVL
ncbi:MAG TPA: Rrf2 family transcriptional regulator [Desulfobaccales bacterium]